MAANTADQHAADAANRANAAQTTATGASTRTDALKGTVSNLDQYSQVTSADVKFAAGRTALGPQGKADLDDAGHEAGRREGLHHRDPGLQQGRRAELAGDGGFGGPLPRNRAAGAALSHLSHRPGQEHRLQLRTSSHRRLHRQRRSADRQWRARDPAAQQPGVHERLGFSLERLLRRRCPARPGSRCRRRTSSPPRD